MQTKNKQNISRPIIHKKRISAIVATVVAFSIIVVSCTVYKTGIIKGLSETIDTRSINVINQYKENNTVEGTFNDRNGDPITKIDEDGKEAKILYSESYSYIIGYDSDTYGKSGLRKKYFDYIYDGKKDGVGANFQLTTDSSLQELAYNLLGNNEGSISIINVKSGEILALASRSSAEIGFNANEIYNNFKTYNEIPAFFINRATMSEDPPGSTFKIITAASLIENDLEKYEYFDEGSYSEGGFAIKNQNNAVYGQTDLEKALNHSVNTYFASAGVKLGAKKLQSTAERFMFNEEIELDFTTLYSNINIPKNDINQLAQTAFGQGSLQISPLQITMIMQAVLNDGEMYKPYLINSITDDEKVVYKAKSKEKLSDSIDKKTAKKLQELLHSNAIHYNMDEEYGYVLAKTGTAEMAKKGLYHKYLVVGAIINDNEYAFCIDCKNLTNPNYDLKPIARKLLKNLNNVMLE